MSLREETLKRGTPGDPPRKRGGPEEALRKPPERGSGWVKD